MRGLSANLMHGTGDLTPAMAALLRAGASDHLGLICSPGQVRKHWRDLRACERLDYLRFLDIERPLITDLGRTAIGAPSQAEADRAKLRLVVANAKRSPDPAKKNDPRTDFDYRSYQSMKYVCTLVVRQEDRRQNPTTVRVGRSSTSDPQFLGPGNSIIQPESEGRFVIALVPDWMTRPKVKAGGTTAPAIFSTYPMPLDESDSSFTDAERATWARLRSVCSTINNRIRNAKKASATRLRYGETW